MQSLDKTKEQLLEELEATEAKLLGTEKALRDSEERFRLLYEYAPLGYQSLDENGYFLEVNQAWLDTLGYSREEVIGKWFGDFLAPGYQDHFKINFPKFKAAREIHWVEFEMLRKDGSQISVAFDGQIGRDQQGRFRQTHCMLHDISEIKRSQDALKESEQRYRAVVDNLEVGIALLNPNMEIVEVNKAMKRYFPHVRPACGQICYEQYNDPPRSEPCWYCPCVLTLRDGQVHEAITETPAGSEIRYYHLVSSPIKDSDGRVQYVIELTEDITERKRVEEALQDSEERLRLTLEATQIGIWDWDVKTDQWYASPIYYTMLGYEPKTGLGDRSEWLERVHPDDRACVNEKIQDVVMRDFGEYQYEARLRHADGTYRWQHVQGFGIKRGEDGKVTRMLGIRMDITERKVAEAALRASEEKYRTLFEESFDGLFITSPGGKILDMNKKGVAMFGYDTKEEMLSLDLEKDVYVHPSDRMRILSMVNASGSAEYEVVVKKRNGEEMVTYCSLAAVRDEKGAITSYRGVIRDITGQKSLQKQLLQAQKMEAIGTLAGGIAHDFNNLLTVVLGFSELLLIGKDERDPYYSDLQKIHQAARSGADLVQRILAFGRKTEITPRSLNLNHEIEQAKIFLGRTIPKMIEIELLLSDELAMVNADPVQIEQLLMNLAVNAKDAMPDGGKLTIETKNVVLDEEYCRMHLGSTPGDYVLLSVSDTGHGMDEETLKHIYEPFYTTKGIGQGTGLGLAMVYGIVKQHGGYTTCYSEPEAGTIFKIYLPTIAANAKSDASEEKPTLPKGTETILLVDDEELVRDLGKRVLERSGYAVLATASGKEALDLYKKEKGKISLVILDLIMPQMGGKQCLEELLKIDPQVKVLIASGYSAGGEAKTTLESGARGFVDKPYDMKQMLQTVRRALDA